MVVKIIPWEMDVKTILLEEVNAKAILSEEFIAKTVVIIQIITAKEVEVNTTPLATNIFIVITPIEANIQQLVLD